MWLGRILDEIGIGRFHYLQNLLLGGISLADGSEILISSSVIGALKSQWDLSPMLRGSMMSIVFVGVMLGGILGGLLGDSCGRRPVVLLSYVGIIIFGGCTALTHGPVMMLAFRLLLGLSFGSGIGPAVALVVESASTTMRSHLLNLGNVWFTIGQVYAALLLMCFMPDLTDTTDRAWREVVFFAAAPSVVLLPFTFLCLQESPHFLLQRGFRSEAMLVVKHMAVMNGRDDVARRVIEQESGGEAARLLGRGGQPQDAGDTANPQGDDAANEPMDTTEGPMISPASASGDVGEEETEGLSLFERLGIAFSPEFRIIVLGGCYLCFLSNFLFYGLNYALPQVFQTMSQTYHIDLSPATEILITTMMDLPAIVLVFTLLHSKSVGHRDCLFALTAFAAPLQMCMVGLDMGASYQRLAFFGTYMSKLVVASIFGLIYIYLGEVFPQACRCTAFSLCVAAGRIAAITAPLVFEFTLQMSSHTSRHFLYFTINSVLCLIGVVAVKWCLVYELKNAPLEPAAVAKEKASVRGIRRAATLESIPSTVGEDVTEAASVLRMRRSSA
mmetsp:Transcript_58410/g.107817  ORF Transcript_58410/g.107817 Transcript_58410/m.107817 type:complete len:558 (-) Transcript_58410:108-1781(-)